VNLRQVEAFHAVMLAGSVTRAAKMLHISQPAVSRLIGDFERVVGFALFVRQHRQLQPTDEAKILFREVQRAFVGLEQIAAVAVAIRTYNTGSLRVVTMPSLSTRFVPEVIAAFSAQYPDVSVWLEVRPRSDVLGWISSAQYDVGITIAPIEDGSIAYLSLCQAPVMAVLPAAHRLSRKARLRLQDLDGERFISLGRDSHFRYRVDQLFNEAGVERELSLEARTADAVFGMVAAGLGVTVMGPLIPAPADDGRMVTRPITPALNLELVLIYPAQKPLSRIAERFVQVTQAYVRKYTARRRNPQRTTHG